MQCFRIFAIGVLLLITGMSLISCAGKRPSNLGVIESKLVACPDTPNCVSSDAEDPEHKIAAFSLIVPADQAWQIVGQVVSQMPGAFVVSQTGDYLHVEFTSAVFGFVDDLELHLRTDEGVIAIRSAARLGKSDFGVNRQRVEDLRSALFGRDLVQ